MAALAAASCGPLENLRDRLRDASPHERYAESLREAGLAETALGRSWLEAAARAPREATLVDPPYRETGYFSAEDPSAIGFRVGLREGQKLVVELEVEGSARLFVDLLEERPGEDDGQARGNVPALRWLASLDTLSRRLQHEASGDGSVLLRLQPELLASVRYTLTLTRAPSLAFPVSGVGDTAIRSGFGASREGGRRLHEGVDIFAPRGTPVVASAAGRARVGTNRLGGNVVWLRDGGRSRTLYYAHLDTQLVGQGARVVRGDTLGLVGNSGNARTTPPHLHFGVYGRGRGPVDPEPFIRRPSSEPPSVEVDLSALGSWARAERRSNLRSGPGTRFRETRVLDPGTLFRPRAAVGEWYRAELPDGRGGYIHGALLAPTARPVARERWAEDRPMREGPSVAALAMDTVRGGRAVPVYGHFGAFRYVEGPDGRRGWVAEGSPTRRPVAGGLP